MSGLTATDSAQAESWMFRRSYYSHVPDPGDPVNYPRPQSRSAYRRPYLRQQPGIAVRAGYRINTIRIQNGTSYDYTVDYQFWVQEYP